MPITLATLLNASMIPSSALDSHAFYELEQIKDDLSVRAQRATSSLRSL